MVASPAENARHVLAITCEPIPKLGPEPEMFMFYGGFDPADVMNDTTRKAGFLAFCIQSQKPIKCENGSAVSTTFPGHEKCICRKVR